MAKQGQHKHDGNDQRQSAGRNNPKTSVPITAGTPKKQETYAERARHGKDPDPVAQMSKTAGPGRELEAKAKNEAAGDRHSRNSRSGSDSNA